MDWNEIIAAVITSGIVITGFELARDWKNKRKHDKVENKKIDYEAQKQGLDLVQEFYSKVKQVTDDQNKQLFERLDKIERLQHDMVIYLNGDFAEWQKEHSRKEEING